MYLSAESPKGVVPIPLDGFDSSAKIWTGGMEWDLGTTTIDDVQITDKNKHEYEYTDGMIIKKPALVEKENKAIELTKNAKVAIDSRPSTDHPSEDDFTLKVPQGFEM